MNKLISLIFLGLFPFLSSLSCNGQSDSVSHRTFSLKISPLAFIDVFGGNSYRIGSEFKLHNNIAASLEYGRYFSYSAKGSLRPLKLDTKGNIVKTEIKYYKNNAKVCEGKFISIEYLYKNISFNFIDSIVIAPTPAYEKKYHIVKEISCVTIKWGKLTFYDSNILFEWYAGVGLRFFTCGHNSLTEEENNGVLTGEGHGDIIAQGQRANAPKLFVNLSAGLKVGYRF